MAGVDPVIVCLQHHRVFSGIMLILEVKGGKRGSGEEKQWRSEANEDHSAELCSRE